MDAFNNTARTVGLLLLLLAWTTFDVEAAPYQCNNEADCPTAGKPICALDSEHVCFTQFPSECHMKVISCKLGHVYRKFADEFCQLIGFMCYDDYQKYADEWSENENIDDVIYSIYKPKNDTVNFLSVN